MEKTHFHFLIWAADNKVGDNFQGITHVDVIATDIKEAKAKAERICPGKRHYWVNDIVEHHEHNKGE